MRPRFSPLSLMLSATLALLAGCDSYRLLDQFELPSVKEQETPGTAALTLELQKTTVQRGEAVELQPAGGTEPYEFAVAADDLYAGTSGQALGSVSGRTYTAGGAIGRIRITVTDAVGASAAETLTVAPPTPALSASRSGDNKAVTLSWSYADTSLIDSYLIQRSAGGGAYADVASPGAGTLNYTQSSLNPTMAYTYRIYAVSGAYRSLPDDEGI